MDHIKYLGCFSSIRYICDKTAVCDGYKLGLHLYQPKLIWLFDKGKTITTTIYFRISNKHEISFIQKKHILLKLFIEIA